ncbi:hypothetical protein SLS60_009643 [Paraconiothyrium brasiliense]|uniref:F-box domain-containing protein n=1 Tax=Paraconiothyrium brasiliense TaxID=300254 RepID=A0ABR3QVB9_9PLEO
MDVYCAFCGAVTSDPYWDSEDEEGYSYDPDIVKDGDVQWMGYTQLIMEHLQSRGISNRYETALTAIPFHSSCFELLKKVIAPEEYHLETLFETLRSLIPYPNDCETHLNIDYGPISELQEEQWVVRRGTEEYVLDPISIPWLGRYFAQLPQREPHQNTRGGSTFREVNSNDPFTEVPLEILRLIMLELDLASLSSFREASRKASQIDLDNSFWKMRFFRDMPWMFDFPVGYRARNGSSIDWIKVYKDLYWASNSNNKRKVHALANRRRIWGVCEHLSRLYHVRKSDRNDTLSEVLDGAQSTRLALLLSPEPNDITAAIVCLVPSYHAMQYSAPTLSVHWKRNGELVRLETSEETPPKQLSTRDDVLIPRGDWITGFIITSTEAERDNRADEVKRSICGLQILFAKRDRVVLRRTEGDQRLLSASPGYFLVGLKLHTTKEGIVAKLALLEQHQDRLTPGRLSRVTGPHSMAYSEEAGEVLWKGNLPPPCLRISELSAGYWSYDLSSDMAPLEALIFGKCEEELGEITSIGADVHFGGFEIHYKTGNVRVIGPRRYAMQYLSINGRGGERITHVFWSQGHIPSGCRFVTNRGRQLVIGCSSSREKRYPSLESADKDCILAGIAGYWPDRTFPQSTLMGYANLYLPDQPPIVNFGADSLRDSNGFHWMPSPPLRRIIEAGDILGQREVQDKWSQRTKNYPSTTTTVSWLDCRHPLEAVRVTSCHVSREGQLPLVAISFIPVDQGPTGTLEATRVGPQGFSTPPDSDGTNGHHWCWCALGHNSKGELESRPHHVHEMWQVGGQLLRGLKVWIDEDGALIGLQFVAADGNEGPRWGQCYRDSSAIIYFTAEDVSGGGIGGSQHPAVGVKFYMDDNERHVTRHDSIVMAVQALVMEESV